MRRGLLGVLVAVLAIVVIAPIADAKKGHGKRRHLRAAAARLVPFQGCDSLIDYGDLHARRVADNYPPTRMPPYPDPNAPGSGPAMGTAGSAQGGGQKGGDFSGTNVQEQDVDEPDM